MRYVEFTVLVNLTQVILPDRNPQELGSTARAVTGFLLDWVCFAGGT